MQIFRLENQCYIGIIYSFLPRGSPAHVYIRVEIQQKDILVAVHKLCYRDRGRAGKTLFMMGGGQSIMILITCILLLLTFIHNILLLPIKSAILNRFYIQGA